MNCPPNPAYRTDCRAIELLRVVLACCFFLLAVFGAIVVGAHAASRDAGSHVPAGGQYAIALQEFNESWQVNLDARDEPAIELVSPLCERLGMEIEATDEQRQCDVDRLTHVKGTLRFGFSTQAETLKWNSADVYDFDRKKLRVECPELDLVVDDLPTGKGIAEQISMSDGGDKLAGWPCWIQDPDYPYCPRCGELMQFVFQLTTDGHVPFMFGDEGIAYLFQCSQHPEVVAFEWQCH